MITTEPKLVAELDNFKIWLKKGIPKHIVDFLETARYGTDGAVYEHLMVADRIQHMHDPHLAYATFDEDLVACILLNRVTSRQQGERVDSYYIRYFNAHPKYKGQGITKKLSILFIEELRKHLPGKVLFYAAMEDGNGRSINIVERVGFKKLAPFKTLGFSRFFPKKSNRISRVVHREEEEQVIHHLESFYQNYSLVHFHNIFQKGQYYIIKNQGEILAGVQMHKTIWRVASMPGLSGKFLIYAVPHIPVLNKMIHPQHFEFITFEGIYYQTGKEGVLLELMEGLLAQEQLKTAILWLAESHPLHPFLIQKGQLGLIHQFVKDANAYLAVDDQYLTPEQQSKLKAGIPYISTFDFI